MLNPETLKNLTVEKIQKLIEKKKDAKKFKTVKLLEEELNKRNPNSKEEKKKRKKAGSMISRENLLNEEKERNRDKRRKKKESKQEVVQSKLTREMKTFISQIVGESKQEIATELENVFKEEIKKLKKEKIFYSCKYLVLPLDEVAHKGIKNIGKEGWVFCYINNEKVTFMKMNGVEDEK